MFLLLLSIITLANISYGTDQHQLFMHIGSGYSQQALDRMDNIYDTISINTGLGYRWNKFISPKSINFFSIGICLGGGMIFPDPRATQSKIQYNSFLDLELFAGYGVGLGKNKQHQMSILGISFIPRFYGLLERDNYTQIGDTEIEWYNGFYIPISVGVHLPGYRYIHNRFFFGFQHRINLLVYGNQNINVPVENIILNSLGYQLKLEFGLNYDDFSNTGSRTALTETRLFVETNRSTILLSLFAKIENKEAHSITIEIFALNQQEEESGFKNLIAYASKIPIYNEQAQFTKHWKGNKNFFKESMSNDRRIIYTIIKEVDKDDNILSENYLYKNLQEHTYEEI